MNSEEKTTTILEDAKINIKTKLAALWATVMFLYIYVDIFGLFVPGHIESIIAGEVPTTGIQIDQAYLFSAIVLMMIPSLMIFLSIVLKARMNRWANIIVGISQIAIILGSAIGESYVYYISGTIVEAILLSLIIWYAWKWPKQEERKAVAT